MEFFSFCRFHIQQDIAAVGKEEGVLDAGAGRAIGFVRVAFAEQIVVGRASEDVYLGGEAAQGADMGLGDCSQPQPRRRAVEACRGQATKDVAPEAFLTVAIAAVGTGTGTVNLDTVHRAGLSRGVDLLADVLRVFPVLAVGAMVVL